MERSKLASIHRERSIDCGYSSWPDLSIALRAYPATGGLCPRRERIAKQLILANLGESLAIADLAQACALSRSHFSRVQMQHRAVAATMDSPAATRCAPRSRSPNRT